MTSSDLVHVPRNPARAPQGVEDVVYGMAKPRWWQSSYGKCGLVAAG
jgi:hypothetical protein